MEANLLYIHENDLSSEFQSKLGSFNNQTIPLFIIVQLKRAPQGFEPMINNLKEIRVEKAKKKIEDWIQICFGSNQSLVVKIDDHNSLSIHVNIDFGEINSLSVFCAHRDSNVVLSYIESRFGKKDFQICYL